MENERFNLLFDTYHGRRLNFEKGCRINRQRGNNVEHSLQDNSLQKISLSAFKYYINSIYIYIYI